ncbi:hypothetical protein AYI70_g10599 [Smittium culicis]|uniref:Uncharacterized protein n=1 Tax=Smittium culicis TaxID=133412 RepID=A0A1R1X5S9_9FUNG|nr:hypothetical protein AYI70_g10599 [Smittium culicis]
MSVVRQINHIIAGKTSFNNNRFDRLIKHTLKFDKSIYSKINRSFTSVTRQSKDINTNSSNKSIPDKENEHVKEYGSEYELQLNKF